MIEVNLLPGATRHLHRSSSLSNFTVFARTPQEEMSMTTLITLASGLGLFLGWALHMVTR